MRLPQAQERRSLRLRRLDLCPLEVLGSTTIELGQNSALPRLECEVDDVLHADLLDRVLLQDRHPLNEARSEVASLLFEFSPETALRAPSTGPEERSANEEEHGRADIEEEVDLGQAVVRDGWFRQYDIPDAQKGMELEKMQVDVRQKTGPGGGKIEDALGCLGTATCTPSGKSSTALQGQEICPSKRRRSVSTMLILL